MFLLRREYRDGAERPEIVFLHAEVSVDGKEATLPCRTTQVVVPTADPGRRLAYVSLPEPPEGGRTLVSYRFSTVSGGRETYSPRYRVAVPSDDLIQDLYRVPEEEGGNLVPAEGRGRFRLVLPTAEGERAAGMIRFGFGAMRKKPSPALCRAAVDAGDGPAPVIEIPEALSVLKNRPMPYFLYHVCGKGELHGDKIACARITLTDGEGDVVSARLIWGDPEWRAVNASAMEAKGFPPGSLSAAGEFFAEDVERFRAERFSSLAALPKPRVFEAYVYGVSGSRVEYCFLTAVRPPSGGTAIRWRNREEGGNWSVVL
jgi:hypothetical protein